jgi:hypothetical protein
MLFGALKLREKFGVFESTERVTLKDKQDEKFTSQSRVFSESR